MDFDPQSLRVQFLQHGLRSAGELARSAKVSQPIDVSVGHFSTIWQRDAVSYAIQSHALATDQPSVLNVTGPGTHETRAVAMRFGEYCGMEPAFTGQEEETAWLNDASKAHGLFGLPETTVNQMIEWVAGWLLEGYPTHGKQTGFEKRDGNF